MAEQQAGKPKPAFYVAVGVVVLVLVVFAIVRMSSSPSTGDAPNVQAPDIVLPPGPALVKHEPGKNDEDPKGSYVFSGTEPGGKYEFVPAQTLPAVTGTSAYTSLSKTGNTVRFAINVWAGWGPIILANEGFKAGKIWKSPQGNEFKVELVKIDDIAVMRDAYASGNVHIGWATLDMVPLLLEQFVNSNGEPRDSRIMPRIFQQIDWSSGGDGIVVREAIKTVSDLKGKQVVLAQHSPSQYFLLRMLLGGGLQPRDVRMTYTKNAFQAANAFNNNKDLAGCVSWAPDIYNLEKVQGNRILVTTGTANKLIADVWFARADFARDHADILEGLVRGIFDAMEQMADPDEKKAEAVKKRVGQLMGAGYEIPPDEAFNMLGDAHNTNWAENYQFFLNKNNPTNFERVWNTAYTLYSHPQVGVIKHKQVPFDQVMDFTFIDKLGKEEKYNKQVDRSLKTFAIAPGSDVEPVGPEIVANRFYIRFAPSNSNPFEKVVREKGGQKVEEFYDPNVNTVLEEIAKLVGTFGAARIILEGHTDSSMRNQVQAADLPELAAAVKKLSDDRAKAVKQALVEKYKFDPNQLVPRGLGWSRPADPTNPLNHALNRRVEVRVYQPEKE